VITKPKTILQPSFQSLKMPSAFEAQPICELKQCGTSRIESLILCGDRLLVGLSTGVLRVYRIIDKDAPGETADGRGDVPTSSRKGRILLELLREEENFSEKPVQRLAIVKEANLLVSLSDAHVSLHDLKNYRLIERMECTKGAAHLAVTSTVANDAETRAPSLIYRLAVSVKRKVLCWNWQDTELTPDIIEINLDATVRSSSWADGTRLVAGTDPGFSIIDATTGRVRPIHKPAARTATEIDPGKRMGVRFGAVRGSGMEYVDMGGWVPNPMATRLTGNHILLAKDVNSLFTSSDGEALEKRQVPWATAPDAIGCSYPYLLALQSSDAGVVQVWNPDTLSLLQTVSVPGPAFLHIQQPGISLAHTGKGFLVASDRVIWRMSAIPYHTQIAELVGKQRFDEAISLLRLLEDVLIDDKAGRIREVKTKKGIALFHQQKYGLAVNLFTETEVAPDRVIALYRGSVAGDSSGKGKDLSGGRPTSTDDTKFAVRCLFSFLAEARRRVKEHMSPERVLRVDPPILDSETGRPESSNLLLQSTVEKGSGDIDWQAELFRVAQLVDTTLFRAYMHVESSLAGSLVRVDNFCDPTVVQPVLCERERYDALLDFLYGKKLHRQVLEMLSRFGKDEEDSGLPDDMRGPRRTISYLKRLPPNLSNLLFEFVQWPIREQPDIGMEVFLADSESARRMRHGEVVDFLGMFDEQLRIQYIEHVIDKLGEGIADLHQRLIDLYIRVLKRTSIPSDEPGNPEAKLVSFLSDLRGSYDKSQTLRQLSPEEPTFHEARAIVLGAMGKRKEALWVYAFQIREHEKARAYCYMTNLGGQAEESLSLSSSTATNEKHTNQLDEDTADEVNAFVTLLGLYLNPPFGEDQNWLQALELLGRHGAHLPVSRSLKLIPDGFALEELQEYLCRQLRNATSLSRQRFIVCKLESVRRAHAECTLRVGRDGRSEEKPSARNRRVRIGEDDHCLVCYRRLGVSAVRVHPDNRVSHYGCTSRCREQ
jgi:hypothetical protein